MSNSIQPEVETIRDYEDKNFEASKKYLGDTYTLAHDIIDLYELLRKMISESHTPPKDEIVTGFSFIVLSVSVHHRMSHTFQRSSNRLCTNYT